MDEQEKNKKKTLRVLIIILLVLLILSILALGSCTIRNYTAKETTDMVVVKDNIITLEKDTSKDKDTLVDGVNGLKEDSEGGNNSLKEESSSDGDSSKDDSIIGDSAIDGDNSSKDEATEDKTEVNITLSNRNDSENVPFQVSNMLPGDKDVKYFRLKVSYKDSVTVKFRANIKPGYEKLAEVLRCKVVLPASGEVLYDGLMMDMPKSLNHTMNSKNDKSGEIYYEITTYLDTNVGNEYMNKGLKADFSWWIDEA